MKLPGNAEGTKDRRGVYRVLLGDLKERDHLEDLSVERGIIVKMDLEEIGWKGKEWIHMAHHRDP
jgi:hypothetical protein